MSLNAGECRQFPPRWTGRMWGGDDDGDRREHAELARAAVRICEECPVRVECLAFGITTRDQNGIYGGLPLRARRNVRRIAENSGLVLDDLEPATVQRLLTKFIRDNPEVVKAARDHERERQRAAWNTARKKRWSETKQADTPKKPLERPSKAVQDPSLQGELPLG